MRITPTGLRLTRGSARLHVSVGILCSALTVHARASHAAGLLSCDVQPEPGNAKLRRLAVVGGLVNLLLAAVKLAAGILGNSYALVADAVESLTDIVGSIVIWGGLRVADRPVDARHPYGYGKAESIAAVLVALLVCGAGVGIAAEAIREIRTPHHAPAWWTLVVLVGVMVTKEVLFRVVRRAASAGSGADSSAGVADAWHHRADAITSLAAFLGISVALIGGKGWEPADDWAALAASCVVLYNGVMIGINPLRELLDVHSAGVAERAATVAAAVPGVEKVQKAFARKSGPRYWVDMHVWVDGELTVRRAHEIAHAVKAAVRGDNRAVHDVLVHIEPSAAVRADGA